MKNTHKKFTLLELLLAIVILVVVLTVVSLSFRTVVTSYRVMSRNTGRLDERLQIGNFADNYLRNIVLFSYPNPDGGGAKNCFDGTEDSLWAVSRNRVNYGNMAGITFFNLYLSDGKLLVKYASQPFFIDTTWGVEDEEPAKILVLSEKVQSIKFAYYSFEQGTLTAVDEWNMDNQTHLPAAVLLTVTWENGEQEVWFRRLNFVQEFITVPEIGAKL